MKPNGRGRGRPKFSPTREQRRFVWTAAAAGIPQDQIAQALSEQGISKMTLHRHFRKELDGAAVEANVAVGRTLFQMAVQDRNVAAAIWWSKARMRWSERQEIDVNQTVTVANTLDFTRLDPEDKRRLRDIVRRALEAPTVIEGENVDVESDATDKAN